MSSNVLKFIDFKTASLKSGICNINPSIAKWRGNYYLAYRNESSEWNTKSAIYLTKLDDKFSVIGHQRWIVLPSIRSNDIPWRQSGPYKMRLPSVCDDPRLLVWDDVLWIAYTDRSHQWLAKLDQNGFKCEAAWHSPQSSPQKNWQFFVHDAKLYCVLNMEPYEICEVILGDAEQMQLTPIKTYQYNFGWTKWGQPRGGTLPFKIGDRYGAFFHSSTIIEKRMRQYHIGYYEFNAVLPFEVTYSSRSPILSANPSSTPRSRNHGHAVLFPSGAIFENGLWTISYGWNDQECRLMQGTMDWARSDE